ncbi:endonuclease YncB(thermonuclease family) [Pararhizobium capsulatum DSM 1112]|uniref:Endonuclease YncB(Thermonuclease family) n=1 Tax=Pararhizobium capsulatum DSM 1112 TaxID=1121113 RepID=A0ABU0BQU7_9HYPH|nr:thermonuclease family protein [Pararhizobium capsulatum]MDQ0320605.1 endonuclease YncB(thermonuclease family) [Pararhizobium capsulatum DSM 1112]
MIRLRERRGGLLRDVLLTAVLLGLMALVVARIDEANRIFLSGSTRVVDGDTLVMGEERIRLLGIDAPELQQICLDGETPRHCGQESRAQLVEMVAQGPVECSGHAKDKYNRLLAVCVAGGRELNAAMVRAGQAIGYGGYKDEERIAQAERRAFGPAHSTHRRIGAGSMAEWRRHPIW